MYIIKPKRLKKGDKVAVVSLSWGGLGEDKLIHKYEIAKERLKKEFELELVAMPNALKGSKFVYEHPELRAKDWMDAFKDKTIKAIFSSIGGDDTIRLLPYIDYDVIKNNPKIFTGFSDTTANHFMMYKAGVTSFYGPCILCDFSQYVSMYDYTVDAMKNILFDANPKFEIKKCNYWTNEHIEWCEENVEKEKKKLEDNKEYEILQGTGKVKGQLLGGCIELLDMINGTELWPSLEEWKDKILFIETSEEKPLSSYLKYFLRNLQAQGILDVINGVIVGKPQGEVYYEEYKEEYKRVIGIEAKRPDLPIIYNVNFGHSEPIGIIPYGVLCELDCDNKKITLLENAVI
ncbi:MAG: LD-carboxypeptidase [Clostridia bacterium]|nr:LD-carboxypeptidase [Clostridia bacterium]